MTASDRTWVLTTCCGRAKWLAQILPGWLAAFPGRVLVVAHSDPEAERVAREVGAHVIARRGQYYHRARAMNFALARALELGASEGDLFLAVDCDTVLRDPELVRVFLERTERVGIGWMGARPDGSHPAGLAGLVAAHFELARRVGGYAERLTGYGFEDIAFRRRLLARALCKPAWLDPRAVAHLAHGRAGRSNRYAPSKPHAQRENAARWFEFERTGVEQKCPARWGRFCAYRIPLFEYN